MLEKIFKTLINCNMIFIAILSAIMSFCYDDLQIYFLSITGCAVIIEIITRFVIKSKVIEDSQNIEEKPVPFIIRINILQILGALSFVACLYFAMTEAIVFSILSMLVGSLFYGLQVKIQNYE